MAAAQKEAQPRASRLERSVRWLMIFVIVGLGLHAALFVWYRAPDIPMWDDWRHIENHVMPALEGSFHWRDLYDNHHPSPMLALLYIGNAKLLRLHQVYLALLGVACLVGMWFLASRHVLPDGDGASAVQRIERNVLMCVVALLLLTPYYPVDFSFPLIIHLCLYVGLALWYVAHVIGPARERATWRSWALQGVAGVVLMCLVHRDYAVLAMAAGILAAVPSLASREGRGPAIKSIALLTATLGVSTVLYAIAGVQPTFRFGAGIDKLLTEVDVSVLADHVCVGLTASLIHVGNLVESVGQQRGLVVCRIIGAVFLVVLAVYLWLFRHRGPLLASVLPLFCVLVTLASFVYRPYPDGESVTKWTEEMSRYNVFRPLAFAGLAGLALALRRGERHRLTPMLTACVTALLLIGIAWRLPALVTCWAATEERAVRMQEIAEDLRAINAQSDLEMISRHPEIYPRRYVAKAAKKARKGRPYRATRLVAAHRFLRRHGLNVFDEDFCRGGCGGFLSRGSSGCPRLSAAGDPG